MFGFDGSVRFGSVRAFVRSVSDRYGECSAVGLIHSHSFPIIKVFDRIPNLESLISFVWYRSLRVGPHRNGSIVPQKSCKVEVY